VRVNEPVLSRDQWIEIDRTVRRFGAANRVSLVVGMVLVPLLFGGVGAGLWAAIPEPFGMWVGGSILGAGALFFAFLLWYGRRSSSRPAFAAAATIGRWIVQPGRYGQQSYAVEVELEPGRVVGPEGLGGPAKGAPTGRRTLRLTSDKIYQAAAPGERVLLLCMPTHEVVAVLRGAELRVA
jgi:hypothetical protein